MTGRRRGSAAAVVAAIVAIGACDSTVDVDLPDAPRDVTASYYAGAVTVSWELGTDWDGEAFRIYAKRTTDAQYRLVAEVTSCAQGFCSYTDANVEPGRSYDYYVAAVSRRTGDEAASDETIRVDVPAATPPPLPTGLTAVALDHANYVSWDDNARDADDFSHYRVWLRASNGSSFLLGETDSEGFLDRLAENGLTYSYFVTAMDEGGHESAGSVIVRATPRPDYTGEWLYDYFDVPTESGFRFRISDRDEPVVSGNDAARHFRLETDANGWWLVPNTNAEINQDSWATTALKCGPQADPDCVDVTRAPTSGYLRQDVEAIPQSTYVLRVRGDDGQNHYGAIRIVMLGEDQNGDGIMIFDWAYQLQAGSVELAPQPSSGR
jgi:hypothetical protein